MNNNIATFEIILNGSPINNTILIREIQINKDLGSQDFAAFSVVFNEESLPENFPFTLGDQIQINLGYDANNTQVFEGKVIETELTFQAVDGTLIIVSCESEETNTTEDHESKITLTYGMNILELDAQSNAQFKLAGNVIFQGTQIINPGNALTLNGLNDQMNGDYETTQVIQHIADGNWTTHCHFEERN